MCTGAEVGIVLGIGEISRGRQARSQANKQARITEQQAGREREISKASSEDYRRNQARLLGERIAAMGASGVSMQTGSPVLAVGDFAAETELNALRILQGGEITAKRMEEQASYYRSAGRSAFNQGLVRGGASLLTGFSDFNDRQSPQQYWT